jgi:hypothetical protein
MRTSVCARGGPGWCAALMVLALVLPATAAAAPPVFTSDPAVRGDAVVGSTLEVMWASDVIPAAGAYTWTRCSADGMACDPLPIAGAVAKTYVPTAADLGHALVATVTLTNAEGKTSKPSPPTAAVVAAPSPPPPPPPPTPMPTPPAPAPVPATTSTSRGFSSVTPTVPAFLRPFPVVRIRGFFARHGARITLLSVRGPRSAKVEVRCSGRGCPVRKLSLPNAETRVHRFERFLRAGMLLQIRVTRPGRIGTYTSFLIRARRSPLRRDRCLSAQGARPIKCAAP